MLCWIGRENFNLFLIPFLFCSTFSPCFVLQQEAAPPPVELCPNAVDCTFASTCPPVVGGCPFCFANGTCASGTFNFKGGDNNECVLECCASPNSGKTLNCNSGCGESQNCITSGGIKVGEECDGKGVLCDSKDGDAVFECLLTGKSP
jgi:hypothetical protein